MAPSTETSGSSSSQDQQRPSGEAAADLAQAYRDLARGEQAATALEANLSNLESKLDAMLAAFEAAERAKQDKNGDKRNDAATSRDGEP